MVYVVIGLFLLLLSIILAIRIGVSKEKTEMEEPQQVIHASGIYSVVKRSPREKILSLRPSRDTVRTFLEERNHQDTGDHLDDNEISGLVDQFFKNIERNVVEVENGDREGCDFYLYHFTEPDPICKPYIQEGRIVTREDIFTYSCLIPPFHIGCSCTLKRQPANEPIRETKSLNLNPLLNDDSEQVPLPDWKEISR